MERSVLGFGVQAQNAPRLKSMKLSINNIDWAYDQRGAGEAIVFVHGWAGDRRLWTFQLEALLTHFMVIAVDLPGHGESDWSPISLSQLAQSLKTLLTQLKIDSIHYVGSSMGGLIGLKLFELSPSFFKSLTLVGALPRFYSSEDYPFSLSLERIDLLRQQLIDDYPTIVPIFFRSLFTPAERALSQFRWVQQGLSLGTVAQQVALQSFLDLLSTEDLRSILPAINIPVLVMNGTNDYIVSLDGVEYLKKQIPQARIKLFDRCGHFPFISQPQQFNQELKEFVSGVFSSLHNNVHDY